MVVEAQAPSFQTALSRFGCWPLRRADIETLQVNVGRVCNQACHHCHVEAGPLRTEAMTRRTAERVLDLLARSPAVRVLDITGGAPELNANFRTLVEGARGLERQVMDRCNLTVLCQPGQEDTAQFLADNEVEVVASLPCYQQENVDRQRGTGVFEESILALEKLNRLGYGNPESPLRLSLVYNPGGPSLPPSQRDLEEGYRKELGSRYGIQFTRLLTLTNMPIRRFADYLERTGKAADYQSLLARHFNPATLSQLMCTTQLSVGYDGVLYDCDFNQMLEMPLTEEATTIWDLESLDDLVDRLIVTGPHCFGCTAGSGSSCGGALA